jgi:hypothetical protein
MSFQAYLQAAFLVAKQPDQAQEEAKQMARFPR